MKVKSARSILHTGSTRWTDVASESSSIDFEEGTIRFRPYLIDPDDIRGEQASSLSVLVRAWRECEAVAVELDLSLLTRTMIANLMHKASREDVETGMDMWYTLPCKVSEIRIVPPRGLFGWSIAAACGRRLLSEKLRERVVVVGK